MGRTSTEQFSGHQNENTSSGSWPRVKHANRQVAREHHSSSLKIMHSSQINERAPNSQGDRSKVLSGEM